MIVTSNWKYVRAERIYTINKSKNAITAERNRQLYETNCEISREIVDIDAFHEWSINANVENFKRSTLQYNAKKASQYIRRKQINCVCDSKSQRIQHEKKC